MFRFGIALVVVVLSATLARAGEGHLSSMKYEGKKDGKLSYSLEYTAEPSERELDTDIKFFKALISRLGEYDVMSVGTTVRDKKVSLKLEVRERGRSRSAHLLTKVQQAPSGYRLTFSWQLDEGAQKIILEEARKIPRVGRATFEVDMNKPAEGVLRLYTK